MLSSTGSGDLSVGDKGPFVPCRAFPARVYRRLPARTCISGLFLIVDIRRGLKDQDAQLLDWAGASGWPVHVLLTKADKLNQRDRAAALKETQELLGQGMTAQVFSSTDKIGIPAAQKRLDEMLSAAAPVSSS